MNYINLFIKTIKNHKRLAVLFLLIADSLFFSLTNPSHLAFYLVFTALILVLCSVYAVCLISFRLLKSLGIVQSHRRWMLEAITGFIFVLLIMQALGQLSIKDILALIPLTLISYWYTTFVAKQNVSY